MKRTGIIAIGIAILVIAAGILAYRTISRQRQEKGLAAAQAANTLPAYENYIRQYPDGLYVQRARSLLEQRRKDLEAKRDFGQLLDSIQSNVTTYLPGFDGVTNAPSGAMLGVSMLAIGTSRLHPANTNPELRQKLSDLESLLNPVFEANSKMLDKLKPTGGGPPQSKVTRYIRSYPAREVTPLVDSISTLVEAEKAKLKPLLAEIEQYERAHKAARPN